MIPFTERLGRAVIGGGFSMKDWWVWCGSVIAGDDGRWHMFASRWPRGLPFMAGYPLRSEVVRAVADRPEGPYRFEQVVLPARGEPYWDGRMTHNPTIHRWGGVYYLYYIGSTYAGPAPTDHDELSDNASKRRSRESWLNINIGLATADCPEGPWRRRDEPILRARPDGWDRLLVTNPAPCIRDDGSTILIYRAPASPHPLLGLAGADHPEGPYRRLSLLPVFCFPTIESKYVEDPFVWWAGDHYEMIAKDLNGNIVGEDQAGVHATSPDGIDWRLSEPAKAYSRHITWSDGRQETLGCFERPQLLLTDGLPTHIFAAASDGPGGFNHASRTWNIVVPLKC